MRDRESEVIRSSRTEVTPDGSGASSTMWVATNLILDCGDDEGTLGTVQRFCSAPSFFARFNTSNFEADPSASKRPVIICIEVTGAV